MKLTSIFPLIAFVFGCASSEIFPPVAFEEAVILDRNPTTLRITCEDQKCFLFEDFEGRRLGWPIEVCEEGALCLRADGFTDIFIPRTPEDEWVKFGWRYKRRDGRPGFVVQLDASGNVHSAFRWREGSEELYLTRYQLPVCNIDLMTGEAGTCRNVDHSPALGYRIILDDLRRTE